MLTPFFQPQGIAVIGASATPGKLGYGVIYNLQQYDYPGRIYPVNPKAAKILGLPAYRQVNDVPDPVDLAVVIVPAAKVVQAVRQCVARQIDHVIVTSGGFAETGDQGAAYETALADLVRNQGVRIIGPNCIGTIDTHTPLNTTFVVGMPQSGDIGFISQSGAMCAVVIDWAADAGIGFSRIVSMGNQVDVSETDLLRSLADDPHTKVITLYMEGVSDGHRFMAEAAQVARRKPVLVIKGGTGQSGAQAVASHTGSLAGSAEAYRSAFAQSGVLQPPTTEALFDWARALAWQPLPKGNRVAVLTNAGGPGVLAVDALERVGLTLAPLTAETRQFLGQRAPAAAGLANPIDILAGSGPGLYGLALDALLADATVDAVLVVQAPHDWFLMTSLAEVVADVSRMHGKPVLTAMMGAGLMAEAQDVLNQRRIPNFAFPERAAKALGAMWTRQRWLNTPAAAPVVPTNIDFKQGSEALIRTDFAGLLKAYGVQLPPALPATTAGQAVSLAEQIGFPVVMKLLSPDITHKTDVGGVALNLQSTAAVRAAYNKMISAVRAAHPQARIEGVLVQKMLAAGVEVLVGLRRDPQFGPLVVVGHGGVEVELRQDIATGIAPLTRAQADALLRQTQVDYKLHGWRGAPPADREAVLNALLALAQIGLDFAAVQELEINPLYVLPAKQGAFAVDVRGSLAEL